MSDQDELLSMKELAIALKRSYNYVRAMRNKGFVMTGGRATLLSALKWLRAHPYPTKSRPAAPATEKSVRAPRD